MTRAPFPSGLRFALVALLLASVRLPANDLQSSLTALPPEQSEHARAKADWLLRPEPFRARALRSAGGTELVLENGLVRRAFRLSPNGATIAFDNLMTGASLLRGVKPEALVSIDGREHAVGGLKGQPDFAYLLPEWSSRLTNDPSAFRLESFTVGKPSAPFTWRRKRHSAPLAWPPPGVAVDFVYRGTVEGVRDVTVTIHYELYDGVPVLGKWLSVRNGTSRPMELSQFTSELLAVVEAESAVDERTDIAWRTPAIQVLSDYMFKGMDVVTGNQIASWQPDPEYLTQVSYPRKTPCLLVCRPPAGPGIRIAAGEAFHSFRAFEIVYDSTDRERQGLALRRAQRLLAPWSTENPIMMHVRNADTKSFRNAVDQCAETGFEMIIYTFGSGLDMEKSDPAYIARIKADVDYAHSKGIEAGAYSLFSSRRIDDKNDVIHPKTGKPGGAIFGNAPCFGSEWGIQYLHKLTNFIASTGLDLLEHDGPYPGDFCASTSHPGHRGEADSQWVNWQMTASLYAWCREQGVFVNQPDYYFLAGGNKTAMGYREDNWSLPRAQQLLHARQNIFDGTWTKTPTMGWMFVPLTEYQGGGAAATIEPLREHLDAYEGHLANNFGAGVQACWRGPRLYDSDETKALVKRWVAWFKQHREILESDLIHVRRADGRDIDCFLHVNPGLREKAMAIFYNPLDHAVKRTVELPLYYSGLTDKTRVSERGAKPKTLRLDRQFQVSLPVQVPAKGVTWFVFE